MEQESIFDDKIVYICKLYTEEAHLIARSNITSIEQLRGQKVNLDELGSGTNNSMRDVFQSLNIKINEVGMTQVEAFEKLKSGEIAATVLIAGKPARSMARLKSTDDLHFLSIPFASSLLATNYLPTRLTHEDYPDMIPRGQAVDTVAVTAVLIAYNWPKNTDRYRRVQKFVDAFFPRIAEFQKPPRHVKWGEVNLAAVLPGHFEPLAALARKPHGSVLVATRALFAAARPHFVGGLFDLNEQLIGVKGLGHIRIRADAGGEVLRVVELDGGQNQHGHIAFQRLKPLADLVPRLTRENKVENHKIRLLHHEHRMRLTAVFGDRHVVFFALEQRLQKRCRIGIVFDDENPVDNDRREAQVPVRICTHRAKLRAVARETFSPR